MRVTVEIVSGPSVGRKMELTSGEVGLVGRASWAQLSVPKDMSMAGQHFNIECGPNACTLRALNRNNPVFLNGTKIGQGELHDGDEVVAGENTFQVRVLTETLEPVPSVSVPTPAMPLAPPAPTAAKPEATERSRLRPTPPPKLEIKPPDLLELLRDSQPLFGLLDAARDPRVLKVLHTSGETFVSLYEGYAAEEMDTVAPYLVRLAPESKLLETLVREAWGQSWGVYLTSHQPLEDVRKHLRHFLMVESEGEEVLFRFYDPRVLRVFLPVCSVAEMKQFFGCVDCFLMEAKEPGVLLKYTATTKGVKEDMVFLFALQETGTVDAGSRAGR